MTSKERFELIGEDFRDNVSDFKNTFTSENFREGLKEIGESAMSIPGVLVGAVKYAPYFFAIPSYSRNVSKNINRDDAFLTRENKASNAYRIGKTIGGVLSNLIIHGGSMIYYHSGEIDKSLIGTSIHLGSLLLGNLVSGGYEYWRDLSDRVEERRDSEVEGNSE